MESAADELGHAGRLVDLFHPFGQRRKHATEVDLLERFTPAHAPHHLADEQDERRGILASHVNAGGRVGGARPARRHDDARAAGELAPRVGGHGGSALVTADGDSDIGVVERVEKREIALPGNAEDALDAVPDERLGNQAGAGDFGFRHRRQRPPKRSFDRRPRR